MKILYSPCNPDWVWEPSFIASAVLYDRVQLPLLQTTGASEREDDDSRVWTIDCAPIRSWVDLPRQATHLERLRTEGVIEDITPPNTTLDLGIDTQLLRRGLPMPRELGLSWYTKKLESRFAELGLITVYFSARSINMMPVYDIAYGLVPKDCRTSLAIGMDSPMVASTIALNVAVNQDRLMREVLTEIVPEVYSEELVGLRSLGASERNLRIPRAIDFILRTRERTEESRVAFRSFMSLFSSMPWEEEPGVLTEMLDQRRKDLVTAYAQYRNPFRVALRKMGAITTWAPMIANLITFNWLGAGRDLLKNLGGGADAVRRSQDRAFAFLLEIEKEARGWAKR